LYDKQSENRIPARYTKIIADDFNAKIGKEEFLSQFQAIRACTKHQMIIGS